MSQPIDILGMGADGLGSLSAEARGRLDRANFLAGGRRHLELVGTGPLERFAIGDNLAELVERLRARTPDERCVVLASGDPLLFGIGHRLGQDLGRDQIRVEPSVSSMQLAFARAGLAWQDARLASVHGRPLDSTLLPLLGEPKIGLFTQDGSSPSAIARFLVDRGLDDYDAWVGERLGTTEERFSKH
jgi:precorrin-6Y C5,15-methyltransferase (decarboxylating)